VNRQAFEHREAAAGGAIKKVASTAFVEEESEREVEIHPTARRRRRSQIDRLAAVKLRRDKGKVTSRSRRCGPRPPPGTT